MVNFHDYDTTPSLEYAGDDFGYEMEECFHFWENPEKIYEKREQRKIELDELAKNYVKKKYSFKDTFNSWDKEKQKRILEMKGDYSECEPGPLRAEPGLIGVWKQVSEHEWQQIGTNLHEEWFPEWMEVKKRMKEVHIGNPEYSMLLQKSMYLGARLAHGNHLGSARTCRYLIWLNREDFTTHYKSAFYSKEEMEYLINSRATFNDLLDCNIRYANKRCARLLDMPVADYMFLQQHVEYDTQAEMFRTPEEIFDKFREECFRTMTRNYHSYSIAFPMGVEAYNEALADDHLIPFKEYRGYVNVEWHFRESLLIDFLTIYRIFEEHAANKEDFIRYDKEGRVDRAIAIYNRLKEWVDLYGCTPYYDDGIESFIWMLCIMDRRSLTLVYNACRNCKGGLGDYLAHLVTGYKTINDPDPRHLYFYRDEDTIIKIMDQVTKNPALDEDSDKLWRKVADKLFGGWADRGEYDKRCRDINKKLRGEINKNTLSDDEKQRLYEALYIFNLTMDRFKKMDEEEIKLIYRERIKEAHPDSGGDANEATKLNTAYDTIKEILHKDITL